MPRTRWLVAAAMLLIAARPAAADLVLTPAAEGNYRVDTGVFAGNDTTPEVGNSSTMNTLHLHAAYAAFNLPAGMTVVGLSLSGTATFLTSQPNVDPIIFEIQAHDVTTSLADLTATYMYGDDSGLTIFHDLSDGGPYGSATVDNGIPYGALTPVGPAFQFDLSTSAVADANAAAQAGRAFILGVSGMESIPSFNQGAIVLDGLKLTVHLSSVPEPGSLALLAVGGAGLVVAARRRRPARGA